MYPVSGCITTAAARTPVFMVKRTPRAGSVPPDSATARAKKARLGEKDPTATPKAKARAKSIDPGTLAQTANSIYDYYKDLLPPMLPKHNTRLRACTKDWYRKLYHTGYHISKSELLDVLHTHELNDLRIKHCEGEDAENMKKALAVLKKAMTNAKIILGSEPEVEVEPPGVESGHQSSQSQQESEDTDQVKSVDESANPMKTKGQNEDQKDQEEAQDTSNIFTIST